MSEVKEYLHSLRDSFKQSQGKDFLYKHTKAIDKFITQAYKEVLDEEFGDYLPMKNSIPIALVAMGSYGREQLCVYSDIDIMIVYEDIKGYNGEMLVQKIVTKLFDTGLKIGHRVHQVDELLSVSQTDITIKTALLESRYIAGSNFVWTKTQNMLQKIRKDNPKKFIDEKIEEYLQRYKKYPVTVEPDIKNTHGGFRDANLIYWIGNILFGVSKIKEIGFKEEQYNEFRKAMEYLFRIRAALHIANKRKNDTLRFQDLSDVANLLNDNDSYRDKFKLVTKTLQSLDTIKIYTKIWLDILVKKYYFKKENITKIKKIDTGIYLLGNCLLASRKQNRGLKSYLHYLIKYDSYALSPSFVQALLEAKNRGLGQEVKAIFYADDSYNILKSLHECQKLATVIPPMAKVMFMPQFDGYHHYSVHKHSLLTLKLLQEFQNDEDGVIKDLYNGLNSDEKAMLKLVALLHDAGKGRKSDHSEIGARIFKQFAQKIDMPFVQTGVKLIKIHTFMSIVSQREDLYDDTVIMKFLADVGDAQTLKFLYLLTVCDMKAVGGNIYNHFTKKLLRTLYNRSLELITQTNTLDEIAKRVKVEKKLLKSSCYERLEKSLQKKVLAIESNLIFLKQDVDEICSIAAQADTTNDYSYDVKNDDHLCIEIIRKKQLNIAYLLAELKRLEVVNMDIYKLFEDLKYFKIDFFHKVEPFEVETVKKIIENSFDMQKQVRLKNVKIYPKEVSIDCNHSKTVALMRLNCQNQSGLLAHVSKVFEDFGIDIVSAKVNTHKNRARDLFLIQKSDKICNNVEKVIGLLCAE
jgi:[protein-PII] uridylyltransferase